MKKKNASKRRGDTSTKILVAAVLMAGIGLAAYVLTQSPEKKPGQGLVVAPPNDGEISPTSDVPSDWVQIGGVLRPKSDVQLDAPKLDAAGVPTKVLHGFSPPVSPVANKQVGSVYAALKDRTDAQAFSSFETAKDFDLEAYKADPEAYLNEIEPSRVFSPAQPGDGVPVLAANGTAYHQVTQGESVLLSVQAVAGAPVTLTSFDLGSFDNELTSITVKANDDGVAQAKFTATGGTIHEVKILAASPMATGQVKFTVNVQITN